MVSIHPERRHLRTLVPEPRAKYKYPDLISESGKFDPTSIADALGADAAYNDKTGEWRFTLFGDEHTDNEFRPFFTLTPNTGVAPYGISPTQFVPMSRETKLSLKPVFSPELKPTFRFRKAVDQDPIELEDITGFRVNPEHDFVEFHAADEKSLKLLTINPRGEVHEYRFPTVPKNK